MHLRITYLSGNVTEVELDNGAYDENDATFYIPPLGLSFVHHVNLNLVDILDSI